MKTLILHLIFLMLCEATIAQNYYVASLQGEVFYNDVLLQKRDRIQVSGTLRFGSSDAWVKLSGPGGLYTLSASMRDPGSSEFLLTVRQELFPPVRHIATIAQGHLVTLDELPLSMEEEPHELSETFMLEVGAHIERCQPSDVEEFLYDYRFSEYIEQAYSIEGPKMRGILSDVFGLMERRNWTWFKPLWEQDYFYHNISGQGEDLFRSANHNKGGYRFLSGTIFPLPFFLQKESHQYAWLHQTETSLTYQLAAMEGDSQIVIRADEFPKGVLRSAIVMTSELSLLDSLQQHGSTIDDAYRLLCACYGVGNYLQRDRMLLQVFDSPGVTPREVFVEDMRFHIEASQATDLDTFLDAHLYGTYIFETYGNIYRPLEILLNLGLSWE
jgi:hypothetical protein